MIRIAGGNIMAIADVIQYAYSGALPPRPAGPMTIMNIMKKITKTTNEPIPKASRSLTKTKPAAEPDDANPFLTSHCTSATMTPTKRSRNKNIAIHSIVIADTLGLLRSTCRQCSCEKAI